MIRTNVKFSFPPEWQVRKDAELCPACGKTKEEFDKGRKVYCSEKCSNKYLEYYQTWQSMRDDFLKEHGEYCDKCKINNDKLKKKESIRINELWNDVLKKYPKEIEAEKFKLLAEAEKEYLEKIKEIENINMDSWKWRKIFEEFGVDYWALEIKHHIAFEVDHKKAIVNGGDAWDKNNLQVLCVECHKKKTKEDLAKRTKGNSILGNKND